MMNQEFSLQLGQRNGHLRSSITRWGALIAGSTLAIIGVTRGSKTGAALATAGGLLAYGGTRIPSQPRDIHAEASFTVNVSPEEAFRYWSNFENLPKFMFHLQSVKPVEEGRWQWIARGPANMPITWTAQVADQRENQWLVWRSLPDSQLPNRGSVEFRPVPGNRGTEVRVAMDYRPPAGMAGKVFARLFGKEPNQAIYEDLRHFKQLMETGEIPTTVGQPHGRRSLKIKAAEAIYSDLRPKPVQRVREFEAERREMRVS